MAGKATVEHGFVEAVASGVVRPGVRVAKVAPGVVTQPLLHGAAAAGDSRPAAEVVLQDVMDRVRVVRSNNDGIHPRGSSQVGQPSRSGCVAHGFRHILTVAYIALGAGGVAHVLLHKDTLVVVAVGVTDAVVALLDLVGFVEAGVSDGLRRCREHPLGGCGGIHGVGFGGGAINGVGEHGLPIDGLGRHTAIAVVGRRTRRRRPKPHLRQAVLAVVLKFLLYVFHMVLSRG